jgi:hypothetical protein
MNDEIWEAAEFITEWDGDDLRYKLFEVPRTAIDGCRGRKAHLLLGIDSGNVRRVDILLDKAYGREINMQDIEDLREAAETAPHKAKKILKKYIKA